MSGQGGGPLPVLPVSVFFLFCGLFLVLCMVGSVCGDWFCVYVPAVFLSSSPGVCDVYPGPFLGALGGNRGIGEAREETVGFPPDIGHGTVVRYSGYVVAQSTANSSAIRSKGCCPWMYSCGMWGAMTFASGLVENSLGM